MKKECQFHKNNFENLKRLNNINEDDLLELSPIQKDLYTLYDQRFLETQEKKLEYEKLYWIKTREMKNFIQQISSDDKKN